MPAGAVVVMDNAPYHAVKTKESWAPTSITLKADMQGWLMERNISWKADMLKSELYGLVKKNMPEPQYVCNCMALEHGFVVVRLPPYHCIFNPIELIWAWTWIKGKVSKENKTFKIADVMAITLALLQQTSACLLCMTLVY